MRYSGRRRLNGAKSAAQTSPTDTPTVTLTYRERAAEQRKLRLEKVTQSRVGRKKTYRRRTGCSSCGR